MARSHSTTLRIPFLGLLLAPLACSSSAGGDEGGDGGTRYPVPDIPASCEGFDAQDVGSPDAVITGSDCNEDAIRAAVEAGGTVRVECPDAPVTFTQQMVVTTDTVLDGAGVTVLDGGGATRLLFKPAGPDLHLQNITIQNGRGPEALGNPEVDQSNWFDYAGGAILVQGHQDLDRVGGGLYGKNLVCRSSATGSSKRDPNTNQILDTGSGGCVYTFHARFHCDGCEFTGNRATNGGAIGSLGSKIQLTNSTCVSNEARFDASSNDNQGFGGCHYQDGTEQAPGEDETNYVHMCGNYFADNRSDAAGGGVSIFYRQGTNTSIAQVGNVFEANGSGDAGGLSGSGGGIYVFVDPNTRLDWAPDEGPDTLVVSRNAFIDNSTEYLGGGATFFNIYETAVRFDNNLFLRNEVRTTDQSTGGGGGLGLIGAFFDLEHNTFAGNRANNWAGGITLGAGGVALRNNLFFDNTAPTTMGDSTMSASEHINWRLDESDDGQPDGFLVYASGGNLFTPSATPSGQPRPSPGAAVLDEDPGLGELDRDSFPYYVPLASGSPAIDAGIELDTVDVDMRGEPRSGAPDIGAIEAGG